MQYACRTRKRRIGNHRRNECFNKYIVAQRQQGLLLELLQSTEPRQISPNERKEGYQHTLHKHIARRQSWPVRDSTLCVRPKHVPLLRQVDCLNLSVGACYCTSMCGCRSKCTCSRAQCQMPMRTQTSSFFTVRSWLMHCSPIPSGHQQWCCSPIRPTTCHTLCFLTTHTHTHTHIYIYINIYRYESPREKQWHNIWRPPVCALLGLSTHMRWHWKRRNSTASTDE